MSEPKVVHFNLFRPENSLFKSKASTPSEVQIITCTNSENCQLFPRGECACRYGLWNGSCPYGRFQRYTGFTRKARKYYQWNKEQEKKYVGVGFLESPKKLGIVGSYVFLPYVHMDMLKDLEWEGRFLAVDDFTQDAVLGLATFHPQALFGGEIKSYQQEIVPVFLQHLAELMPDVFRELSAASSFVRQRHAEWSNIGREAVLETVTPNVGKFVDIHGGVWTWDGTRLHSSYHKMSFGLCKAAEISMVPLKGETVKITDEGQVNSMTEFKK